MGARGPAHPEVWGLWRPRDLSWGLCASRACVHTLPSSVCLFWPTMGIRKTWTDWLVTTLWPDSEPASASPGCHHRGFPNHSTAHLHLLSPTTVYWWCCTSRSWGLKEVDAKRLWMWVVVQSWSLGKHWKTTFSLLQTVKVVKPWAFTFEGELLV